LSGLALRVLFRLAPATVDRLISDAAGIAVFRTVLVLLGFGLALVARRT
jgi:hypothetical protein